MRGAIIDGTAPLRLAAPDVPWLDQSRLHLTLKFLGEQPDAAVPRLRQALDAVTQRHRPFTMHLAEIGAFPNFRRARVVWIGIRNDPRLELLHHDIEIACEELGFEVDGRSFRPHLTLARVRDDTPEATRRALARVARRMDAGYEAEVSSVDLMRSNLDRSGSRYECLHAAALRPN